MSISDNGRAELALVLLHDAAELPSISVPEVAIGGPGGDNSDVYFMFEVTVKIVPVACPGPVEVLFVSPTRTSVDVLKPVIGQAAPIKSDQVHRVPQEGIALPFDAPTVIQYQYSNVTLCHTTVSRW